MDLHNSQNIHRCVAEGIGTFWLTFAGCGSAVIAAAFPDVGIGLLGVSLAFGLTVLTMAYAIGHISGCHLNPAVTVGLAAGGHFPKQDILPYVVSQVIGAVIASAALYAIATGSPTFDLAKGFAANGYGAHSPGQYSLISGFIAELILTMMFLFIIMGATHGKAPVGFAPIAIGLGLTLIHLVGIPITNTSVNPARSSASGSAVSSAPNGRAARPRPSPPSASPSESGRSSPCSPPGCRNASSPARCSSPRTR